MNRLEFIKKSFGSLGTLAILPIANACAKETAGSGNPNCPNTNAETAGPFTTKSPTTLAVNNIVSDRKGTALSVNIIVKNGNNNCAALKDALVDIWHCDAAGAYSEYGGSGIQATDYTAVHFLRGRQTTDANGMATWTSIYPGWYPGRAPHIHVQVFNSSGKSLLITQIAFPEDVSKQVYAQGVYTAKGAFDTANNRDIVFGDGFSSELATITGTAATGFVLTHTIYVSA
jgi:protocatechuate 3,4-dioxygenase beta subunit